MRFLIMLIKCQNNQFKKFIRLNLKTLYKMVVKLQEIK